jgi:hypothetical protein
VLGAGVVVFGLAQFVLVGDPDAGVDNASTESLLVAILVVSAVVVVLLVWLRAKTSRHCAPQSSASAQACTSVLRRASRSRSSTTSTSASVRRPGTG